MEVIWYIFTSDSLCLLFVVWHCLADDDINDDDDDDEYMRYLLPYCCFSHHYCHINHIICT